MNGTTFNQTLDIHGRPFNHDEASCKIILSVVCIGIGIFLWPIAILFWIVAAILPYKSYTFLDFGDSRLVTLKYYGWFQISSHHRPLTDFGRIVVGHVCHSGGEGPDTFTGSVGLKPKDGGAVFWLKEFPTTQDEMPREAHAYARRLQEVLPLPMTVLGLEFLDLEKTTCGQSKTSPESDQTARTLILHDPRPNQKVHGHEAAESLEDEFDNIGSPPRH